MSAVDDLVVHDAGLLDVASSEGIDVAKKLQLGQDDIELELTGLLPPSDNVSNVVVTTALRLWHAFHTLELVYRDAYMNQLNDRYAGKRDQFRGMAQWAADRLISGGVAMTTHPVQRADVPQLSYHPGQHSAGTYYACTTWVDAQGAEGAAGDWSAISAPEGNVLSVRASNQPKIATGWNVFIGLSPETISRQNESVLDPSLPWIQQGELSTTGAKPADGQKPDITRLVARILLRG